MIYDDEVDIQRPRLEPDREHFRDFAKRQGRRWVRVDVGVDMRDEPNDPFILFANGARSDGQFHHAEPPKKGSEELAILLSRYHTVRAEQLVRQFKKTKDRMLQEFATGQSVEGYKEKLQKLKRLTKWHDEQAAASLYNAPSQVRERELEESRREEENSRRLALNQAMAVRF